MDELKDLAAAYDGSKAEFTLNSRHAMMYDKVCQALGMEPAVEQIGGGAYLVKAEEFCEVIEAAQANNIVFDDRGEVIAPRNLKRSTTRNRAAETADPAVEETVVASPVADLTWEDAKTKISTMRSKENLQVIAEHDTRVRVQEAAQKRLEELNQS